MRHQARSYALQALYQAELLQSKAMKHADRFLDQLETSPEIKEFARELVAGRSSIANTLIDICGVTWNTGN